MKNITRTITVYAYTFGKFNPSNMSVEIAATVTRPYKMGEREVKRVQKSIGGDVMLLSVNETTQVYSMDIETFIRYATPIDGTETAGDTDE